MRTIGLIGGMSWESSADYYRIINQQVRARLGPLRSAQTLMLSIDFGPIEQAQREGRWEDAALILEDATRSLYRGGAECILLCTNTMHLVSDKVAAAAPIPFLHIADSVGKKAVQDNFQTVGLLGTDFTMEKPFLKEKLNNDYGINVMTPKPYERTSIHRIIYEELCAGIYQESSRMIFQRSIRALASRGAQAVILGCTEIGQLLKPEDSPIPVLDSTELHAMSAVDFSMTKK